MEKQFVFESVFVNYTIVGNGTPVLLIHGYGEDSSIWQEQVDELQKHHLVIIPDVPGSGKSDMLVGDNFAISDYAICMYHLLQHENIEKCYVVGHSMGGYITLAFAKLYPLTLLGFGLINSTAFSDSAEKKNNRLQAIELIREHGSYAFLKNAIPMLFSKDFKIQNSKIVESLVEKSKKFKPDALIQYNYAMMNRPNLTEILQQSKVKVLFVIGTEDNAAPLQDLLQQTHLPEIAFVNIIQGTGHMSMLEAPKQLNKFLVEFTDNIN